jgi:hypothetical protein
MRFGIGSERRERPSAKQPTDLLAPYFSEGNRISKACSKSMDSCAQ